VLIFFIFTGILTMIGAAVMKRDVKRFIPGYLVLVVIAVIATVIASQRGIRYYGFEYVLWALFIGLFISNVFKTPEWLKPAIMTEFFIKIGLVCMGAEIMFSIVIKAGAVGLAQAVLVVIGVWFVTYWICRKFGLSERFSSIIATGNSICGVSASHRRRRRGPGGPQRGELYRRLADDLRGAPDRDHAPWPSGPTFLQYGRSLDRRGH
jgi:Kef-type K+ transport system membrane component KefB